jgi:hypothetical protein
VREGEKKGNKDRCKREKDCQEIFILWKGYMAQIGVALIIENGGINQWQTEFFKE